MAKQAKATTPKPTKPQLETSPDAGASNVPRGKIAAVIQLLDRPEGARLEDMMAATGWQAHSVRGAMSGSLKKKLGFKLTSEKTDTGRVYRIVRAAA